MNSLEQEAAIGRFWYRAMLHAIELKSDPVVIHMMNHEYLESNRKIRDGEYVRSE